MKTNLSISISDMKKLSIGSESYYFTKETMNFWNCKIHTSPNKYGLFITSEDNFDKTEILYSIRFFNLNNPKQIETISFQKHKTLASAKTFVLDLTKAFNSLDCYREKTVLESIESITVKQQEPLVLTVTSNNGDYFRCNTENYDRFICG
jgi:hypothetical protein